MSQVKSPSHSTTLKQDQRTILKALTIVGYLEGTSFLLLLGVAMPLKYMMGIEEAVRYIGMGHGVLFIAYIVMLMIVVNKIKGAVLDN